MIELNYDLDTNKLPYAQFDTFDGSLTFGQLERLYQTLRSRHLDLDKVLIKLISNEGVVALQAIQLHDLADKDEILEMEQELIKLSQQRDVLYTIRKDRDLNTIEIQNLQKTVNQIKLLHDLIHLSAEKLVFYKESEALEFKLNTLFQLGSSDKKKYKVIVEDCSE